MIPVTQTKVSVKNSKGQNVVYGNCFAASIASMLELTIEQVPNVETFFDTSFDYYWLMNGWMYERYGLKIMPAPEYRIFHMEFEEGQGYDDEINKKRLDLSEDFYLCTGHSPRGILHICIYQAGQLIWDPHPTREGILDITDIEKIAKP